MYTLIRSENMGKLQRINQLIERLRKKFNGNEFVIFTLTEVGVYAEAGEYRYALFLLLENMYEIELEFDRDEQVEILYLADLCQVDLSTWSDCYSWIARSNKQ